MDDKAHTEGSFENGGVGEGEREVETNPFPPSLFRDPYSPRFNTAVWGEI